jgi:4-diphosphocytidyl-2-C-methyl-D-erythritol kinase
VVEAHLGRVRATAYAKLTLSLRVLGVRPDGYHELDGLAVSIGQPTDVVEARAVPHPGGVTFELEGEAEHVPTGLDNLSARAAEDLLLRAGRLGHGVRVVLRKRIPAGAGLGGGSADAAATLVAVRRLLEIDVDDQGLTELAARLGSDVPFCLRGGAARMRGRGEIIERVAVPRGVSFVVALPPFRLATPEVYAAWDELGGPKSTRIVEAPPTLARLEPELVNDLEPAAVRVEPRLADFRRALENAAGAPAIMAGSGSAYAVPLEDETRAAAVANHVGHSMRVPAVAARIMTRGVRLGA